MNFFDQVYTVVKKIPKGEVRTYGQVAQALGTRVVFKDGHLAPNYAFGGAEEQKKKLVDEGGEVWGDKVFVLDRRKNIW